MGMTAESFNKDGKYPIGSEQWAARVRRHATSLQATLEQGYMELAAVLYLVYDTPINGDPNNPPIFREWGFESWQDWVTQELGMRVSKAQYLRRIYYMLYVELADMDDGVRTRISKLGVSKVRKLLRVLTPSNAERWCDLAETHTTPELAAAIEDSLKEADRLAEQRALAGEDDTEIEAEPVRPRDIHNKMFMLWPEQVPTVEQALARAQELSMSKKPNHNITLICMDFLANNDFRLSSDADMQKRYIAKLEGLMNKKIVLIDPEHKEIEYGASSLKALLEGEDVEESRSLNGSASL